MQRPNDVECYSDTSKSKSANLQERGDEWLGVIWIDQGRLAES